MIIRSNLKHLLDERGMSIRELERRTELKFETLRRLYHDDSKQYHRVTLARVCAVLNVKIDDLLILEQDDKTE